jgi:hypothetical protein
MPPQTTLDHIVMYYQPIDTLLPPLERPPPLRHIGILVLWDMRHAESPENPFKDNKVLVL